MDIDFQEVRQVWGNDGVLIIWWVKKNQILEEFRDTVMSVAHDTVTYEIFY